MSSPINLRRGGGIPASIRRELIGARHIRKMSQKNLAELTGLVQMHVSEIETGKVSPRFDTLLEIARVLDYDLILVPRTLVPAVQSMIRTRAQPSIAENQPLYAHEAEDDEVV